MSVWGRYLALGSGAAPEPLVPYLQYVRTNYSNFALVLYDWVYDLADTWELVFKQNGQGGTWPRLVATQTSMDGAALFSQYTLDGSNPGMTFVYNGANSRFVSYSSPYDYDSYYKLRCSAGDISILKGSSLSSITELAGETVFDAAEGDTGLPIYLFTDSSQSRFVLDVNFYSLTAWRRGIKIH